MNTDDVSDGYHTFGELYDHRSALFIALMRCHPKLSWYALFHDDGVGVQGFFIAGMNLPTGQVTYHMKLSPWMSLLGDIPHRVKAPKWDGHTAEVALDRIKEWMTTL